MRGYIPECNCGPNEKLTNKGNFVNQDLFKKMLAEKPTREDIRKTSNDGWKDNAQWVKGGNKSTAGVPRLSFRIYDVYDTTK